ncbi:hypothetical protein Ancab_012078 [Ancistrocladus abbreviatus]
MDEWVQNPTAHTALDDFLPCLDNATAQYILSNSQNITFELIDSVNMFIADIHNADANSTSGDRSVFYNQSGPLVPAVCNPFYPNKTQRTCSAHEVDLGRATKAWKDCTCKVSEAGMCTTVGRLTPDIYVAVSAAAGVSYGLYHYSPFLVDLGDCRLVRETFSDIYRNHCPGLTLYSKWVYAGLAVASSASCSPSSSGCSMQERGGTASGTSSDGTDPSVFGFTPDQEFARINPDILTFLPRDLAEAEACLPPPTSAPPPSSPIREKVAFARRPTSRIHPLQPPPQQEHILRKVIMGCQTKFELGLRGDLSWAYLTQIIKPSRNELQRKKNFQARPTKFLFLNQTVRGNDVQVS